MKTARTALILALLLATLGFTNVAAAVVACTAPCEPQASCCCLPEGQAVLADEPFSCCGEMQAAPASIQLPAFIPDFGTGWIVPETSFIHVDKAVESAPSEVPQLYSSAPTGASWARPPPALFS